MTETTSSRVRPLAAATPPLPGVLKARLQAGGCILAPGVYDMFSARLASRLGYEALYLTGYGVSGSHLGLPDAGLMGYSDIVDRARTVAGGITQPLIADADTGFGNVLNVQHTVRGYEAAGVQAIQIEDQESPKKCGHTPGKRIVETAEMIRKIEVAVAARRHDSTLIIARTDARAIAGLDEAITRANAYAKAGADIIFVEAPQNAAEFERIGQEVQAWKLANIVPSGMSPEVPIDTLQSWGYSIALYPAIGMTAACGAMDHAYRHLLAQRNTFALSPPPMSLGDLHTLMGFEDIWAFERQFADNDDRQA